MYPVFILSYSYVGSDVLYPKTIQWTADKYQFLSHLLSLQNVFVSVKESVSKPKFKYYLVE